MSLLYKSIKSAMPFAVLLVTFSAFSACNIPKPEEPKDEQAILRDSFEQQIKEGPVVEMGKLTTKSGAVSGIIQTKTIELVGNLPGHRPQFDWKGTHPNLMYYANCDNSIDIAWLDRNKSTFNITKIDSEGNVIKSFPLQLKRDRLGDGTGILLGFTKVPSDNSYAVAYGRGEKYVYEEDNEAYVPAGTVHNIGHYYIARYDASGKHIWTNHVFGDDHARKWGDPFNPGSSSTGRLEYDARTDSLFYFVGINRRTGKLQIHQASTFGAYDLNGKYLTSHGWYISHNYEQRIMFDQDNTYFFGHGDSGPYGLFVGWWKFARTGLNEVGNPTM